VPLFLSVFFALAGSVGTVACGDDGNDTQPGPTTNPDEGDSGTGQGLPMLVCSDDGDGVCINDTDCPLVEGGELNAAAQICAFFCLGSEADDCIANCLVDDPGLTEECAICHQGLSDCVIEFCLEPCSEDPNGAACGQCLDDEGCESDFVECSGLERAE
jgi:hypothetical protein